MRKVLGMDILPGESPLKGEETKYACVLLVNGEIKRKYDEITLRDLLNIVKKQKVDAIAVDNVFELAPTKEHIVELLKLLEFPPRIIEVTRIGDKRYKLESIASSLSLSKGRLSPIDAAEICAKLAFMGIGSEALFFEDETRIVISRGRSPTQGGMSKERYRRNVELLILRLTKEVKKILESKNIDYDLYVRKAVSGLESSLFIVYAPRSQLYGLIKKRKGYDIQVDIEPVSKSEIEFVPLSSIRKIKREPDRYIILGIDPGISTGVALLSLDGRIIDVFSRRWLSRRQLIKYLSNKGKVLVVATDVNPPSLYARKLASSLNAILFIPPKSLSIDEKREIVSNFISKAGSAIKIKDAHQRDALSAAIKALYFYKPKLEDVERELDKLELGLPSSEVKALVIRGNSVNDAIQKVSEKYFIPPPNRYVELKEKKDVEGLYKALKRLEDVVVKLRIENKNLRIREKELVNEIREKEETIEKLLSFQGMEFRRSRHSLSLESQINALKEEVNNLLHDLETLRLIRDNLEKIIYDLLRGKLIGVIAFNRLETKLLDSTTSISGKIIAIDNSALYEEKALEELINREPRAVILCNPNPVIVERLEAAGIPVITELTFKNLVKVRDYYLISSDLLNVCLEKAMNRIKEREKAWKERIKAMLMDYKRKRARLFEKESLEKPN